LDLTPEQQQQNEWNAVAKERADGFPVTQPETKVEPGAAIPEVKPEEPKVADLIAQSIAKLEEKLNGQFRNLNGQFGGLKSEQLKIQEALQAAATKAAAEVTNAPTKAQVTEAMKNPQEWQALRDAYPEWGDATEKFVDARLAAVKPSLDPAAIEKLVRERVVGETAAVRKEIVNAALDAVSPGWEDEVKSEQFANWFKAQTPEIQALEASDKVGDAARMLKLYEQAKKESPNVALTEQRQAVLKQAVALPKGQKSIPQKSVDDMTPAELWDHEARLRDKQKAQRGY
jgi:hypothetical protein